MSCIKCGHHKAVKNGSVAGKTKKQCTACGYQFTKEVVHDYQTYPLRSKLLAVGLYLSGLSLRRMRRLCDCSTPLVRNWVRNYGREHYEKPALAGQSVLLEVDAMWPSLKKNRPRSGSGTPWRVIPDRCVIGKAGVVRVPPAKSLTNDATKRLFASLVLMTIRSRAR
jgi:transposase-like protein